MTERHIVIVGWIMIVNSELTVYHKILDESTRLEKWVRYNYNHVWWFGGHGSSLNKGYEKANDVQIRIPYYLNENADISHFAVGDIILQGKIEKEIKTQSDLSEYDIYNITSINNNTFGREPHIHLGGK